MEAFALSSRLLTTRDLETGRISRWLLRRLALLPAAGEEGAKRKDQGEGYTPRHTGFM